jgi:hypothetical protein
MVADGGVEYDGFYFDDINVKIVYASGISVNQITQENELQLYPNPNNGKFLLLVNDNASGAIKISISNLLGEMIFLEQTLNEKTKEIDLTSVVSGTYFVHVQTSSKNYTQKVIIGK